MHKQNHRRTWKEFGKRIQTEDESVSSRWGSRGEGRFWKRQLSKVRRRAWKEELEGRNPRALSHWERICNWKNW